MLPRVTPERLTAPQTALNGPPENHSQGHLQKQFHKSNVKKLKHQLKHVMEALRY